MRSNSEGIDPRGKKGPSLELVYTRAKYLEFYLIGNHQNISNKLNIVMT